MESQEIAGKVYGKSADYNYLMTKWFPNNPFKVVFTEGRGRYLISTKHLHPGDNVVSSFPFTYVTCDEVKEMVCQYCFEETVIQNKHLPFMCKDCNQMWYCSQRCMELDSTQHKFECKTLGHFFANVHWDEPGNKTEVRLLCRTLSRRTLEKRNIKLPKEHLIANEIITFSDFMRLISSRTVQTESLLKSLKDIVDYVKSIDDEWLSDIDEEELLDVVLKTRNNMFNIFKSSTVSLGWGVYIEASLFNHSCQPNTCLFRRHNTPVFEFVAIQEIPIGTEITVTYLGYGDLDTRRSHLKEHYFFDCDCLRCKEESAGSTTNYDAWYNAYHCKNDGCLGYVVPFPKTPEVTLFCNYCSFSNDEEEDSKDDIDESKN